MRERESTSTDPVLGFLFWGFGFEEMGLLSPTECTEFNGANE